jgi:hypothetical protein
MRTRSEIRDFKGRTLVIERDVAEIRERGPNDYVVDGDPMDGPIVARLLRWESFTIDGEPANRRRVGQFVRRIREERERREL